MTVYYLDTNICIDLLRNPDSNVVAWMLDNEPADIKIPAIVEAELYVGIYKSDHPQRERKKVDRMLRPFETVPFDSTCAQLFGELRAKLQKSGNAIGPNDMLIAAMALANHATLVTHNQREFSRVSGLHLEDWTEVHL